MLRSPHLYNKVAPPARRICDQQCKKPFATISLNKKTCQQSALLDCRGCSLGRWLLFYPSDASTPLKGAGPLRRRDATQGSPLVGFIVARSLGSGSIVYGDAPAGTTCLCSRYRPRASNLFRYFPTSRRICPQSPVRQQLPFFYSSNFLTNEENSKHQRPALSQP